MSTKELEKPFDTYQHEITALPEQIDPQLIEEVRTVSENILTRVGEAKPRNLDELTDSRIFSNPIDLGGKPGDESGVSDPVDKLVIVSSAYDSKFGQQGLILDFKTGDTTKHVISIGRTSDEVWLLERGSQVYLTPVGVEKLLTDLRQIAEAAPARLDEEPSLSEAEMGELQSSLAQRLELVESVGYSYSYVGPEPHFAWEKGTVSAHQTLSDALRYLNAGGILTDSQKDSLARLATALRLGQRQHAKGQDINPNYFAQKRIKRLYS